MKPLDGVRILDLSRVVSGPFCTMLLADLGAEVIKIEEPATGDDSRAFGPPFIGGESAYFLSVNRNKQSCAINLKSPEGVRIVQALAASCDVMIDNFRPGTMERLGLGYEGLRAANPRLVSCSITGFGRTGPDANRPGYDLIIQGESGIMDITGEPTGLPTKVGTSIADLLTGQFATQGIMAALLERSTTGKGRHVDIAMLDCMASLLTFNAGIYFTTGQSPKRRGNAHPTIAPYETFKASDGWLNIGVANDKFWQLFCGVIERPDLANDSRYAKAADRVAHREVLVPLVADIVATAPRKHWIERLARAGVPYGDIRSVQEVCEAEQLTTRGMIVEMEHPTAGVVKNIVSPFRFDDKARSVHTPPPVLAQHTTAILKTFLNLSDERLEELSSRGVIRRNEEVKDHG
ncbi:Crotonobetainyl-CoA:carnitine CoA-transferase CaiB [Variovorax sp. CF079]|uniref:CaiB/BaiF CoA transferase family protein n=1 Tax=Variovorax sp. CF079 TaxID=1882774 RepID=UPI0008878A19|nr:CaiB/BaiF CoA-transferase family protein [Variovorax sp. CF079]SDE93836.1 Crotonobetainyl-CoA:carnitine CoA-transferase CaiB [Variovorax sp. CF079]